MKIKNVVCGLFIIGALGVPMAYANPWWVDAGVGMAGFGDSHEFTLLGAPSAAIDVNYMLSQHQLITARATDITFLMNVQDVGIMYGLIQKWKYGYISASAGLAYTHLSLDPLFPGSDPILAKSGLGIPLEINAGITPFKHLGFGVKIFANVNKNLTGYGAVGEISVGHLSF